MCDTDAKDLGNLERRKRSVWPKGLEAGFVEEVGIRQGFGAKKYLDSWRKAGPESYFLAKQICNTADLVQSGDDEIR